MKRSLHFSLFVLSLFLFLPSSKAQTDRVQFARIASPAVVKPTEINTSSPEKKVIKSLHASPTKRDSLTNKNTAVNFSNNSTEEKEKLDKTKQNGAIRRVKTINETDDNKTNIDAPLYPDFQVTATKEEPYNNNNTASKEAASAQLVKLEKVPQDDFQVANVIATAIQSHVTLSPLKRKYLEGIAAELEQEIKNGKKLSIETQARKKELDDLKKLLAE